MDIETMNNHMHMLVEEPTALANPTFHHLTKEELELCQSLKGLSIFNNARLEQERIAWRFATERIMKTVSDSSNQ
jgi:REP element-mobilizing transposase RayT